MPYFPASFCCPRQLLKRHLLLFLGREAPLTWISFNESTKAQLNKCRQTQRYFIVCTYRQNVSMEGTAGALTSCGGDYQRNCRSYEGNTTGGRFKYCNGEVENWKNVSISAQLEVHT